MPANDTSHGHRAQPAITGQLELTSLSGKLTLNQLVKPSLRCLALVLVLVLSTGPLIWRLIVTSALDLAALLVASLWFLGDLVPSAALVLVLHDAILAQREFNIRLSGINKRASGWGQLSLLQAICLLFVLLYALDLVIFLAMSRHRLDTYRYVFFHIQVWLSLAYMSARVGRSDLRQAARKLEKIYTLALQMARALIRRLDLRGDRLTLECQLGVPEENEQSARSHKAPAAREPKNVEPNERSVSSKAKRGRGASRPSNTSAIRVTSSRRGPRRRKGAGRGRAGSSCVRQSIVSNGAAKSAGSSSRRRQQQRRRRQHDESGPARTVNLNLNVN